ncbi:MAG: S9 family peptidase [Elusimicrobia bacterium]|nr:S9 family peptidase [Elusimicrobiota bacterium]
MAKRPILPEDLLRLRIPADPQTRPDGGAVLFTVRETTAKNETLSHVFTASPEGNVRQWTRGGKACKAARWRPDGRAFSFLSAREEGRPQFFVLETSGGEARRVSDLPEGTVEKYAWSPDGRCIAFTFRPTAPEWTEAAKKEREAKGLSAPPRVLTHGWYRLDGDGYFGAQRYALYLLDVATGQHRRLYGACKVGQYRFDWAPDSRKLAVTHTVHPNPWPMTAEDALVVVPLSGAPKALPLPKGRKVELAWSPDGRRIAYVGHENVNDPWDETNLRLFLTEAAGGPARCLTAGEDLSVRVPTLSDTADYSAASYLAWDPSGKSVYVSVGLHGAGRLARVSVKGGLAFVTPARMVVTPGPVGGARMGVVVSRPTRPPEVAFVDLRRGGAPRTAARFNDALLRGRSLARPEEFWTESADGTRVHGWVLRPPKGAPDLRRKGKRPAVLQVHGGPHAQYGWTFFHEFQCLAGAGYTVVYGNPRGSLGYGEDFNRAISGDWGTKDWADVQALALRMRSLPDTDVRRLGIMGGSYGGYMTNWAVGHTREFKAAVSDRCVSNFLSMAGSSDFPFFQKPYWPGSPWGDMEKAAELWRQSPISCFDQVETPMLIIHSEGDLRCNVEQSEQVFTALQVRGVESRFVRYPASTSHGMSRGGPADLRVHRLGEILAWWKRHLRR